MAEKSIKTRVQMKHDSSENWDRATGFKPLEGEIIFYSDFNKIKVGQYKAGTTDAQKKSANHTDYLVLLSELPFLDADTLDGKHATDFAAVQHGTHVTTATVKSALGTGSGTTKYLREDGTWAVPPNTDTNTTYDLTAPTSKTNGNVTIDLKAGGSGSGTDSVQIKGSGATTVTTDADGVITISSPEALKNPNALSIGGKSYDGSSAVSVTAAELRTHLGLNNALHFVGLTTTAITDNATTKTITVDGKSYTAVAGDVVLYNDNEYVFDGSKWLELGDGSSHALKSVKINAGAGLTGDGTLASDVTLAVGQGNGITVTDNAVAAKAGNGITVDSAGINHADTSSQASVTASGRKYITGVTLDTYGHVTGLTTGTETVTDTHNSHAVISGKKADGSTDIKGSASAGDITLGDSGVTAGEYGPTANATPGYGATFNVPDIKVNSKGIVTSVVNRTVKIPAVNTDTVKTEVASQINTLISSGTADPSASTTSQYYFKYI